MFHPSHTHTSVLVRPRRDAVGVATLSFVSSTFAEALEDPGDGGLFVPWRMYCHYTGLPRFSYRRRRRPRPRRRARSSFSACSSSDDWPFSSCSLRFARTLYPRLSPFIFVFFFFLFLFPPPNRTLCHSPRLSLSLSLSSCCSWASATSLVFFVSSRRRSTIYSFPTHRRSTRFHAVVSRGFLRFRRFYVSLYLTLDELVLILEQILGRILNRIF